MGDVFEAIRIGVLSLPNRFIRSATYEGLADDDGRVTNALRALYDELAHGDIGLIIAGYAYVTPNGQGSPRMLGISSDSHIEGLAELVSAVQRHGAKIAAQIVHCGRQTFPGIVDGSPVAPSPVAMRKYGTMPRELTAAEIDVIIDDFARAAVRAREAGFDAVQIHAAHGYLLNQFLAANTNRRTDRYGGDIEGRATALFETYSRIRRAVGTDYPVLIKMNCADFVAGGLQVEESLWVAERLAAMGIDAIEVSGGVAETEQEDGKSIQKGVPVKRPEAYFLPYAEKFENAVGAPIIAVGGIRSLETAQEIVQSGKSDLVSMCRPFISEPHLIKRWREGDRSPAHCVSCNRCFARTIFEGVQCFRRRNRGNA
jgi:2,4-dienoyl-CoA reductase-like NADH-dependent reductase (Old Yellow Enzyme family)